MVQPTAQGQNTTVNETDLKFDDPGKLEMTKLPTEKDIEQELGLVETKKDGTDPVLDARADKLLDQLLSTDLDEVKKKRYINELGMKHQVNMAQHSKILDQSIKVLSASTDGGPVAKNLLDLRNQVEELNPNGLDFSSPSGAVAKLFRRFLGKANPVSRYFEKYESAGFVINDIMANLGAGRDGLIDDNQTLELDKKLMRDTLKGLTHAIELGNALYKKMEIKLKADYEPNTDEYRFIQEEMLFPLNQRIIDLQTTLAVNQQGVISFDLLIRNNNELINGVNRTITITTSALRVAVTTRLALEKQRKVLEAKKKIDQTTNDLIEGNAKLIQTQGVEIQKMATESTLNVDQLSNAFESLNQAMDEISTYRRDSLPAMRDTVNRFKTLTDKASTTINKMERGAKLQDNVILDVTDYEVLN